MKKQLVIKLSEEATQKYLERARKKTTAEVEEACVPSGFTLMVEICPPFGVLVFDSDYDHLGDADIEWIEDENP